MGGFCRLLQFDVITGTGDPQTSRPYTSIIHTPDPQSFHQSEAGTPPQTAPQVSLCLRRTIAEMLCTVGTDSKGKSARGIQCCEEAERVSLQQAAPGPLDLSTKQDVVWRRFLENTIHLLHFQKFSTPGDRLKWKAKNLLPYRMGSSIYQASTDPPRSNAKGDRISSLQREDRLQPGVRTECSGSLTTQSPEAVADSWGCSPPFSILKDSSDAAPGAPRSTQPCEVNRSELTSTPALVSVSAPQGNQNLPPGAFLTSQGPRYRIRDIMRNPELYTHQWTSRGAFAK
ncbi:hypothetical protein E5288_WYG011555 [Bos mutus]|uniref:Uncharacterized protein n=1 Tax=Bos mutus TaxID=72004 RepID=A0A6B0RQQ0_9CETA|nr:hypothetical protein [Bos mutus]